MIYKPSKLIYSSLHIDKLYHFYGIIFHEYHYIRISVLTDPPGMVLVEAGEWVGESFKMSYKSCVGWLK